MARTYLWCDSCRRSFDHIDATERTCPICHSDMKEVGWITAFARGLLSHEMTSSGIASRHRRLIQEIWTANGMGERYYKALDPGVTYSKFERVVTDFVCTAAEEGWVTIVLPRSPLGSTDQSYQLQIDSEERFVEEMSALFIENDS